VTKEKSSVRLIGRTLRKKIGGKKGKGVTGWFKPNHATVSIKKKRRKREEERENRAREQSEVTTQRKDTVGKT